MKQLSEEKYIIIVVTHDYEFLNRACKRYIRINENANPPAMLGESCSSDVVWLK